MTLDWSDASMDAAVKGHFFFVLFPRPQSDSPIVNRNKRKNAVSLTLRDSVCFLHDIQLRVGHILGCRPVGHGDAGTVWQRPDPPQDSILRLGIQR